MHIDFSLCMAQARAHRAFQRRNITVTNAWGRGIGKSWFLRTAGWYLPVLELDGRMHKLIEGRPRSLPGVRVHHLMPTLEQSKKVHGQLLAAEINGDWKHLGGHLNKADWRVSFPGGSYIQWLTAERAQQQRGIRTDIVTADEADDLDPGMYDSIVKPFFSEPYSLRRSLLGGTPRRGRKGLLYKSFKLLPEAFPDRYRGFHATAYDAPALVDPQYVEDVRADTPEEIFKREWLCDFDAAEGLVYPMFSEAFHVRLPPEDVVWTEILFGADHGWEDPGVILCIGILGHGRDATAWVLDEVVAQHKEPDWWLDRVRERVGWYPDAKWYPDHKPEVTSGWARAGANIQEVDKGAGSIEGGVAVVQRWLHIRDREFVPARERAQLYIHPRCKHTINEMGLYRRRRNPRNTEEVLEDIEDANNHTMDALRYALVNRFEVPGSMKRDGGHERRDR